LGCASDTDQPACLRRVDAQKMLDAAHESWNLMARGGLEWSATIDGAVLPDQWAAIFRSGQFNKVPVMVGDTKLEPTLFVSILENGQNSAFSTEQAKRTHKHFGLLGPIIDYVYPASGFPSEQARFV